MQASIMPFFFKNVPLENTPILLMSGIDPADINGYVHCYSKRCHEHWLIV